MKTLFSFLNLCAYVLLAFLASWFISEKLKSPEITLYNVSEKNLEPCMNYWTSDTGYTDTMSISARAMRLYDQGEYAQAIESFQRMEPNENEEANYDLYLGICYLKSGFANLAVIHLSEAESLFKKYKMIQMSKWYLSLAYLKAGQEKEGVDKLFQLVGANAPQRYKAEEILATIDGASNPIKSLKLVLLNK